MPEIDFDPEDYRHSEDIRDIISTPPAWLLRWGITVFLGILILIFGLSIIIHYPEIIKTELKIISEDAPVAVVSKINGKLVKILANENSFIRENEPIGFLKSTANHDQVLSLFKELRKLQHTFSATTDINFFQLQLPSDINLGELQASYQTFFDAYLAYKGLFGTGTIARKKEFLLKDLKNIQAKEKLLVGQKELQSKELELSRQEFEMHSLLRDRKVESTMEFKRQESKYIASQRPLQQLESDLLAIKSDYSSKQQEIMELANFIQEERSRFVQSLGRLLSEVSEWRNSYVLYAPRSGTLNYAGMLRENQSLAAGQEAFFIYSGSSIFEGEMQIPQYNMGKVKKGQKVLIKLKSYPFEEYGIVTGFISSINNVPVQDSIFQSRVSIPPAGFSALKEKIELKNGMKATAEIITDDASIFQRIYKNIVKVIE